MHRYMSHIVCGCRRLCFVLTQDARRSLFSSLIFSLLSYLYYIPAISIGRCGRWGRKGVAINFITEDEVQDMQWLSNHYKFDISEMPMNIADLLGKR